jgi:hypothetical protein
MPFKMQKLFGVDVPARMGEVRVATVCRSWRRPFCGVVLGAP